MKRQSSARRLACACSAVVVLGIAPAARAQSAESAEQVAAAREMGIEGIKLADSGDYAGAIDKLTRAESLHHAPTTLERLGECHVKVGKLVLGTEELQRVMRESLPPNAPAAFTAAQDRAKAAYTAAAPRIGKLRIHVDHADGVHPDVKIDGEAVPEVLLDADRPTDPGPHDVTASAPGMKAADAKVTLSDGQSTSVALKLEPDPSAVAIATPAPVPAAPPPVAPTSDASVPTGAAPADASSGPNRTPAYVALGVGGAGLVVGTLFGVMALSTQSTLNSACNSSKACPASSQSDIDSLGTKATISTIGFGVGIAGVAVGGFLFFRASGSAPPSGSARVVPYFGPGSAGVTGEF